MPQLLQRDIQRQARGRESLVAPGRQLRTGRLQHPAADIDNQAAFFGGRHEIPGMAHAFALRLPAQQRLEPGQRAIRDRVLRLVEQRKLTPA